MIGIWQSYSNVYLVVVGVAMLATFGIPLLVVPLRWARVFRWEVPKPENLVVGCPVLDHAVLLSWIRRWEVICMVAGEQQACSSSTSS